MNQTPIITNIYKEYKKYDNNNIYSINTLSKCYEKLDKQELNFLLSVIKKYSDYSATKLFCVVQDINTTLTASNDIISKQEIKTLFENIKID